MDSHWGLVKLQEPVDQPGCRWRDASQGSEGKERGKGVHVVKEG